MDLRFFTQGVPSKIPVRVNNFLKQDKKKETKNLRPSPKPVVSCKQYKFLQDEVEAKLERDILTLVDDFLHYAQNNQLNDAKREYQKLEIIITGDEELWWNPKRKFLYLNRKVKIISLYIQPEHFKLLDNVRRELARYTVDRNNDNDQRHLIDIFELDTAKNLLKAIDNKKEEDIHLLSAIYSLMSVYYDQKKDEKHKTSATQKAVVCSDNYYRDIAFQAINEANALYCGNQSGGNKLLVVAESALNKIHQKTPTDETLLTECAFYTELSVARYTHNRHLMFEIIGGGTVPGEAREKLLAIPVAETRRQVTSHS